MKTGLQIICNETFDGNSDSFVIDHDELFYNSMILIFGYVHSLYSCGSALFLWACPVDAIAE